MLLQATTVEPSGGWLRIVLAFFLIVTPIYLFLVVFVRIVREAYGFTTPPEDDGPPIRICQGCDTTIIDLEYSHCPYCGHDLPVVPSDG